MRAIEVYAVPGRRPGEAPSPVSTTPVARTPVISGGPESLLELADWGLARTRATVLAADLPGPPPASARWIVTDAFRHARADYGLVHDGLSYTLRRDELAPGTRRTTQLLDPALVGHDAVATLPTAPDEGSRAGDGPEQPLGVTASSYGSWLLGLPELQPGNAFDDDPTTAWVAGDPRTSRGQWVQETFRAPRELAGVTVRLLREGAFRPRVVAVTAATERGSRTTRLADTERPQPLPVPSGPTRWLRVTLVAVTGERGGEIGAGLRSISVPGVRLRSHVGPAQEPGMLRWARTNRQDPTYLFSRLTADPDDLLRRDEEPVLRRTFEVPVGGRFALSGRVVPRRGAALDRLLTRRQGLGVAATSSYNASPRYRPGNAFDGTTETTWIAAPPVSAPLRGPSAPGLSSTTAGNRVMRSSPVPASVDARPALVVTFRGRRRLSAIRVVDPRRFASPPSRVRLVSPAGRRTVAVSRGRLVRFPSLVTRGPLRLEFVGVRRRYATAGGAKGGPSPLPVGVADIELPGLGEDRIIALPPALPVATRCGDGPDLLLDGRRLRTRVSTTAGAATDGRTAPFRICDRSTVDLASGSHRLEAVARGRFSVNDVKLVPERRPRAAAAAPRGPRRARVVRWGATDRRLALTAGAATYLAMRQNVNRGWSASLDGRPLRSVTIDGWQQGFVVPAGSAGTVQLVFGPDRAFRLALLLGAALALALAPLAVLPESRRIRAKLGRAEGAGADGPGPRLSLPGSAAPALGTWSGTASPAVRGLWWAFVGGCVALVSLPAVVVFPAVAALCARVPVARRLVAAGAVLGTSIATAVAASPFAGDGEGPFGAPAQVVAALGLGAVLTTLVPSRRHTTTDRRAEIPVGAGEMMRKESNP